jgi:hypothetical protein
MNVTTPAPRRTVQEYQISESILVGEKAGLAVVTAMGDVLRDANKIESARPGHDRFPAGNARSCGVQQPSDIANGSFRCRKLDPTPFL